MKNSLSRKIVLLIVSGGALNEIGVLSIYGIYATLSSVFSISPNDFQFQISLFFFFAFIGSCVVVNKTSIKSLVKMASLGLMLSMIGSLVSIINYPSIILGRGLIGFGNGIIYTLSIILAKEYNPDVVLQSESSCNAADDKTKRLLAINTILFFSAQLLIILLSTYIERFSNWRIIFIFIACIYGYFWMTVVRYIRLINSNPDDSEGHSKIYFKTVVTKEKIFYISSLSMILIACVIYLVSSPVLIINIFQKSQFLYNCFFIGTICMSILGSLLSMILFRMKQHIRVCFSIIIVLAFINFSYVVGSVIYPSFVLIMIAYGLTNFFFTSSLPLFYFIIMDNADDSSGMFQAISQAVSYLSCFLSSIIITLVDEKNSLLPSSLSLLFTIIGLVFFLLASKKVLRNQYD